MLSLRDAKLNLLGLEFYNITTLVLSLPQNATNRKHTTQTQAVLFFSFPHPSKFPETSGEFQQGFKSPWTVGRLTCTDSERVSSTAAVRAPGCSDSDRCITVSRCFSGPTELYKSSYSPASSPKAPREVRAVCAQCSCCRHYWSQQRSAALQTAGLKEQVALFNRTFTGVGRTDVARTHAESSLVWPTPGWPSRARHREKKDKNKSNKKVCKFGARLTATSIREEAAKSKGRKN